MTSNHMTITLTHSQMRDAAMRSAGLSPRAMAIKPGIRVERNRRAEARRGHVKHKSRFNDC